MAALSAAARLLGRRELLEERVGLLERDAGIRDAQPVNARPAWHVVLPPRNEVTFEHCTEDLPGPGRDLLADRRGHVCLTLRILETVDRN